MGPPHLCGGALPLPTRRAVPGPGACVVSGRGTCSRLASAGQRNPCPTLLEARRRRARWLAGSRLGVGAPATLVGSPHSTITVLSVNFTTRPDVLRLGCPHGRRRGAVTADPTATKSSGAASRSGCRRTSPSVCRFSAFWGICPATRPFRIAHTVELSLGTRLLGVRALHGWRRRSFGSAGDCFVSVDRSTAQRLENAMTAAAKTSSYTARSDALANPTVSRAWAARRPCRSAPSGNAPFSGRARVDARWARPTTRLGRSPSAGRPLSSCLRAPR